MAKLTANGRELERWGTGNLQYSIRSNGKVLRRFYIVDRWERWTHAPLTNPERIRAAGLERVK